jgi:hypothetical protein
MPLSKLSEQPIDQVLARLSANNTNGFNNGIAAQAPNYSLPSDFININFSLPSVNFFLGQIDFDNQEISGYIAYPAASLYTLESANQNLEKFHQFSGAIRVIFEVAMSWDSMTGRGIPFEYYSNCIEDVVVNCINCLQNQNWASPVSYNGQIQCKRGPIIFAGNNLRQRIGFSMIFVVDTAVN